MQAASNLVTVFAAIPETDLPPPGTWVEVTLSNGMVAQVWNLRRGETLERRPRTLTYMPVEIAARNSEVVHAAITRRVNGRNRANQFTLCDRNGKRIVTRIIHAPLGTTVTCKQCREQLEEDGML